MIDLLLQSSIDVSVPETTRSQWAIAIFILLLLAVGIIILQHRLTYWGLSDQQRETRANVRLTLLQSVPELLAFRMRRYREEGRTRDGRTLRGALREGFANARRPEDISRTSSIQAARRLRQTLGAAWRDRVAGIPGLTIRALRAAALVAVFGAVAVSTDLVVRALSTDPRAPRPDLLVLASGAGDAVVDVIAAFPFSDLLWALGFSTVIIGGEALYQAWWLVVGILLLGAVAVYRLETAEELDIPEQVVRAPSEIAALALVLLVLTWGTGVAVSGLVAAVAPSTVADVVGFVGALGVAGVALWSLWSVRGHGLFRFGITAEFRDASSVAKAYLGALYTTAGASVVAVLFIVVYAVAGVLGGQFLRVGRALITAAPEVQATIAFVALAVVALVVYALRAALPDARTVLAQVLDQQVARLQVVTIGMPIIAVVTAFVLAVNVVPWPVAILIATAAGVVLNVVTRRGVAFAHGTDWASVISLPTRVWLMVRQWLVKADGTEFAVAEVAGYHRLANPDRSALIDDLEATIEAVSDYESPPPTRSQWYARFLIEHGISDPEEMEQKLNAKVRRRAVAALRDADGELGRGQYDARFEELPDDVVAAWHAEHEDIVYRGPNYVRLLSDPYVQERMPGRDALDRAKRALR